MLVLELVTTALLEMVHSFKNLNIKVTYFPLNCLLSISSYLTCPAS